MSGKFKHAKPTKKPIGDGDIVVAMFGPTVVEELIFMYLKGAGKSTEAEMQKFLDDLNLACTTVATVQAVLDGTVEFVRGDRGVGFRAATPEEAALNRENLAKIRRKLKGVQL